MESIISIRLLVGTLEYILSMSNEMNRRFGSKGNSSYSQTPNTATSRRFPKTLEATESQGRLVI